MLKVFFWPLATYLTVFYNYFDQHKALYHDDWWMAPEDTVIYWPTGKVTPTTMLFLAYIYKYNKSIYRRTSYHKENLVHKYIFLYSPRWPRRTGHFPAKRSTVNLKNAVCNKYKVRWRFNIYLENKSSIDIKVKRYVMRCCWKPINTHITGRYIIGD